MTSASRRLLGYVGRYRRDFLLGLTCVVTTQAITLAAPLVLLRAIDGLTRGMTHARLIQHAGLLLAIGVAGNLFRFQGRRILNGVSRHIESDIRNDFFAHLERLPLAYYQTHRTGDLMSRAANDLNAVRMMIGPAVLFAAYALLVVLFASIAMLSIDARLTSLALIPLPLASMCVKVCGKAIDERFEQIQAQLADLSAVTQEALAGVRVLRTYRQEAAELARFRRSNEEYFARSRKLIVLQGLFIPSMSFFFGLGALVLLWMGSADVIRGRLTLGELVAFNAYFTMLAWPMYAFGWVTNLLQRGTASWRRLARVFEVDPAIADVPNGTIVEPHAFRGVEGVSIEFRHLLFAYNGRPVLDRVSARIDAGQTVAIVGLTGSGKSTLISLVARLNDPPPGTVFVDGLDVRDVPLAALRGAIGFVPQEPFLFSDTLADNIAFGLDARHPRLARDERRRRVVAAATVAGLDEEVAAFPHGYETRVGERGMTLSGGQKQRVALARALAIDPRILILDDALSAVDTSTEEEILSRLRTVMRQRTSIIVSHRISTVRAADVIFVLDRGRIVERGTDAELLARGGFYAALFKKQQLEQELAGS